MKTYKELLEKRIAVTLGYDEEDNDYGFIHKGKFKGGFSKGTIVHALNDGNAENTEGSSSNKNDTNAMMKWIHKYDSLDIVFDSKVFKKILAAQPN